MPDEVDVRRRRRRRRLRFEDRLGIVGGAIIGTQLRFGMVELVPPEPDRIPWATLTVNVVGAFLLGIVVVATHRARIPDRAIASLQRSVATGLLGAFTTFSAFAVEIVTRAGEEPLVAAAYGIGSVIAGLVAAASGARLAGALAGEPSEVAEVTP